MLSNCIAVWPKCGAFCDAIQGIAFPVYKQFQFADVLFTNKNTIVQIIYKLVKS
jgi:hypothetical protein